jgi:hypothetical protein
VEDITFSASLSKHKATTCFRSSMFSPGNGFAFLDCLHSSCRLSSSAALLCLIEMIPPGLISQICEIPLLAADLRVSNVPESADGSRRD